MGGVAVRAWRRRRPLPRPAHVGQGLCDARQSASLRGLAPVSCTNEVFWMIGNAIGPSQDPELCSCGHRLTRDAPGDAPVEWLAPTRARGAGVVRATSHRGSQSWATTWCPPAARPRRCARRGSRCGRARPWQLVDALAAWHTFQGYGLGEMALPIVYNAKVYPKGVGHNPNACTRRCQDSRAVPAFSDAVRTHARAAILFFLASR